MMGLQLTDEQAAVLLAELDRIIDGDRYPLSPRIQTLKAIRAMLRPYPADAPAQPPQRHYEPPSNGRYRRRR
jgi:hypothetical protein